MTLCTSDTKKYGKIALIYLLITGFCALFGAVYEYFSFGVYSYYMLYAFGFPLIGGALPALVLCLRESVPAPWAIARWIYRGGIATLTVGSIICGVLEIYGTTNQLTQWYWYFGGAMTGIGAMLHLLNVRRV